MIITCINAVRYYIIDQKLKPKVSKDEVKLE